MNLPPNPRIVLAGSVNSSRKTLQKLIEYHINVVGILALDPAVSKNVSGYNDLSEFASEHNISFLHFKKINDPEAIEFVKGKAPDLLFVIGLSQLVKRELLDIPTVGCVGFHPTKLPEGRGRGAIAWIILGVTPGAATFFFMDEGMDSGGIIAQEAFSVEDNDYAQDIIDKVKDSISAALDRVLPDLKRGVLNILEQDESKATYVSKREPKDGLIDWKLSSADIHRLIRAVSSPLPGAYTYYKGKKVIVHRASLELEKKIIGVPGRVIEIDERKGVLVQTGEGLLWLEKLEGAEMTDFAIGRNLGFDFEAEIIKLQNELQALKER